MIESELLRIRVFLVTVTLKTGQEKLLLKFIIGSVVKTNPWTYEIKYLNGEKIVGRFYEKDLLLNKL